MAVHREGERCNRQNQFLETTGSHRGSLLVFLVVNFVAVVALALFLTWAGRMQTHSEMLDQRDFPSWLIAATILALVIGFALLLQSQRTKR